MKRSLLFTMCAFLAGVGSAAATPINGSATGLTSPDSTITFDEHVLASNSSVTNEYADLGVTFSPNVYYDPQEGFTPGKDIGNFTFPTQPAFVDPMTMSFGGTRSGVAFLMAADNTPYTFTALLGGVAQDSFTATVSGSAALYYGFEGVTFDQLMVAAAGAGGGPYWLIDNIQQSGASAVPEPASLVLLGSGLFMAARRRWTA